jgi:hypothetical protein
LIPLLLSFWITTQIPRHTLERGRKKCGQIGGEREEKTKKQKEDENMRIMINPNPRRRILGKRSIAYLSVFDGFFGFREGKDHCMGFGTELCLLFFCLIT